MIAKTTGFKLGDKLFATLEEAQRAGVAEVFVWTSEKPTGLSWTVDEITDRIMDQRDTLLEILSLTPRSRPKARKHAGTTNPKRAAKAASPAVVQSGLTLMREAVDGQPA